MSTRLQVLMDHRELKSIQRASRKHGQTVADWVRDSLRARLRFEDTETPQVRSARILAFAKHHGPTGDIDAVLAEIERGRGE